MGAGDFAQGSVNASARNTMPAFIKALELGAGDRS